MKIQHDAREPLRQLAADAAHSFDRRATAALRSDPADLGDAYDAMRIDMIEPRDFMEYAPDVLSAKLAALDRMAAKLQRIGLGGVQ